MDHMSRKDYLLDLVEQCYGNIRKCCETMEMCKKELQAISDSEKLDHILYPGDFSYDAFSRGPPPGLGLRPEEGLAVQPVSVKLQQPQVREFDKIVLELLHKEADKARARGKHPREFAMILSTIRERFPVDKRALLPPTGSRGVLKRMVDKIPGVRSLVVGKNNEGYFLPSH